MQVIATGAGYFGKLRKEGEVFEVPDKLKASWFKPVAKGAAPADAETKAKADAETKPSLV